MRKCWYPAFFPFFTMFSTPLRDQSHSLIHILFVLCRSFRLMSLKFYCLVIHISHKTLEIGCAWSKGSGERLQGHHGPLVSIHLRSGLKANDSRIDLVQRIISTFINEFQNNFSHLFTLTSTGVM